MMLHARTIALILSAAIELVASPVSARQLEFDVSTMKLIERQYTGEPFLLVLWATDCPPCRGELELLGRMKHHHPEFNLVLVSIDGVGLRDEVVEVLAQYHLVEIDFWIFAGPNVERLRYTIDSEWYGEMPRSYFYAANSKRRGVSGTLMEENLLEWMPELSEK